MTESEICKLLGCSGMNQKCPGNPECEIIKKYKSVDWKCKGLTDGNKRNDG